MHANDSVVELCSHPCVKDHGLHQSRACVDGDYSDLMILTVSHVGTSG